MPWWVGLPGGSVRLSKSSGFVLACSRAVAAPSAGSDGALAWFSARAKLSGGLLPSPALRTGVGAVPTMEAGELALGLDRLLGDMVSSMPHRGVVTVAAPQLLQGGFVGAPLFQP